MISALKLPFTFDESRLITELERILQADWTPHFNTHGYTGAWNVISLYAPEGDAGNIFAGDDTQLKETPVLKNTPYLKEVVSHFKCPLSSVRLLRLAPGAHIKPHRDYKLGYEDGCFRIHIPITTNPQVSFMLDHKKLTMLPGTCWYTNVNFEHAVSNEGDTDRVHLVIDGQRNAWSDELFFALASEDDFFPEQESMYTAAQLTRMIAELQQQDSPAAASLITQFQEQLDAI